MSAGRILWGQIGLVLGLILVGVWGATQWTAWRLAYQPALGAPWFEISGHAVYPPPAFFVWWFAYDAYAPRIFLQGGAIAAGAALLAIAASIAMAVWRSREAAEATTYGTARWGDARDARQAGLLGDDGVLLGALEGRYLRHDGPEHVLCFAPTRSGKGVGLVVPTLLTWGGSALVHDIKGENWSLTAGWRSRFGPVLMFDPTNPHSAAYNPLMEVRPGALEVRDVQNIADILVDPEGALERRNHWEKTSHSLLVGTILHVLHAEPDKTLAGVANFLSDPERPIEATLRRMMTTPHRDGRPHPVIAAAARELLNKSENERSGVLSTAMSFLGLYRDPVIAAVTGRCDWRIDDLVDGDRPVSLYLVVPPSDISRTKPLIRLILNQIGRRLTEDLQTRAGRRRLLMLLDEFPALGRLDFFETALAFMAGYGLKAFLIAQSLNQIEKAYGPNNAILDNCHVRVAFATNDERTAKRISETLGTATELRAMRNYAGHRLSPWLGHLMVSRQETARPLLTPGEVMQLPSTDALVLASGCAPLRVKKARYYTDPQFQARLLPAPASPTARPGSSDFAAWRPASIPPETDDAAPACTDDGGPRREQDPEPPDALARPLLREAQEGEAPDPEIDEDDGLPRLPESLEARMRRVARQVALDPDDGIDL
jgi:type IV secretion system protein VirD4